MFLLGECKRLFDGKFVCKFCRSVVFTYFGDLVSHVLREHLQDRCHEHISTLGLQCRLCKEEKILYCDNRSLKSHLI